MIIKKIWFSTLFSTLFLSAANTLPMKSLEGSWLLQTLDGHQVYKARSILDFHAKHKKIDGFDGCNRITGKLDLHPNDLYSSKLHKQPYECRTSLHAYVSKHLDQTIAEGFTIQKATMKGEKGILLKSTHHTLFFKKLGGDSLFDTILK